jgi:hypothetical protein
MSFEAEYLTMMPSTMVVFPFLAFDNYGDPSYGTTGINYRCRIEYEDVVVRDQLGQDVVSNVTAYVAATTRLNKLSQYVLPDGTTGVVQSIAVQFDDEGIHHNVVHLGG